MLSPAITGKFQSWEHREEFLSALTEYVAATCALSAQVAVGSGGGDAARGSLVLAARAMTIATLRDSLSPSSLRPPVQQDLEPTII